MEPTQRTLDEADRVELVYQYALAQLGAKTVAEVLALWQSVPTGQAAQTASVWLEKAATLILTRRGQARELGIAFYRVVRALRTGKTVAVDETTGPVSLELLRQEFEALVAEHTGEGTTSVTAESEPDGDDDSIEIEEAKGFAESLEDDDKLSPEYVDTLLEDMAEAASAKVDAINPKMSSGDAKAEAKVIHAQHGAMIAAAGARVAMNGGRNATNQVSARDPQVLGWIRQHGKSDQPCYFCSMNISRRVLYKSAFTAGKGQRDVGLPQFLGDGMFKYHDNCHCTALAVYTDEDFTSNSKYAQNRYYGALWDKHIKGKFSGPDALNEWRKLLRRIRANDTNAAAPEAA